MNTRQNVTQPWPNTIPSLDEISYTSGVWPITGQIQTQISRAHGSGFTIIVEPESARLIAADEANLAYAKTALKQICVKAEQAGLSTLSCGQVLTRPYFAERGVTLSASTLTFSQEFMDKLLTQMGKLRLNQLLFEAAVAVPGRDASWPYWRPEEIRWVIERAKQYHVDVIPEVNAPSHMAPFLTNRPDLALHRADGQLDLDRLDFTRSEAVDFYLDIVDAYSQLFDSSWWHMGADEFEYANLRYEDFPQIGQAARAKFGDEAEPRDLFIDFINQINAGLAKRGKRLRIWNDGITKANIVKLDSDIVVEYWVERGLSPAEHIANETHIYNAAVQFYWSRSEPFKVDSRKIYEQNLGDNFADDKAYSSDLITGLKCSIWPDRAWMQTENEVLAEIQDGMALVAQLAWSHSKPYESWDELSRDIPRLDPQELTAGSLTKQQLEKLGTVKIPALDEICAGSWQLLPTPDGYIRLRAANGKFLALKSGARVLGVPMEPGASLELSDDVDPQALSQAKAFKRELNLEGEQDNSGIAWNQVIRPIERPIFEYNCQKWVLKLKDEGIVLRSALSGLEVTGHQVQVPSAIVLKLGF